MPAFIVSKTTKTGENIWPTLYYVHQCSVSTLHANMGHLAEHWQNTVKYCEQYAFSLISKKERQTIRMTEIVRKRPKPVCRAALDYAC